MTKGKGDNPSPWGRPTGSSPKGGNGSGNGGGNRPSGPKSSPPNGEDIDELIRRSQEKFKGALPSFGSGKSIALALLGFAALWMASGIYKVEPEEEGVVLRFGKYHRTEQPGLRYHLPEPFETVLKPEVTRVQSIQIGVQGAQQSQHRNASFGAVGVHTDGRMLTGDNNVIIVPFSVQWKIKDAKAFLFNIRNPEATVKDAAESVMREVVSNHPLDAVLSTDKTALVEGQDESSRVTVDKGVIEQSNKVILQRLLDTYGAGIKIERVQLTNVHVPEEVREAFDDVQAADQDRETTINKAASYANDILPRARGEAEKLIQDAGAYKAEVTNRAEGDASRFVAIYEQYRDAKDVTKKRLYLETIESIMRDMDKVILDQKGGSGVVPYMSLPEIQKRQQPAAEQKP